MPLNLTEIAAFGANVSVPVTGEPRIALSVRPAFQELADRSLWLRNGLNGLLVGGDRMHTAAAVSGAGVWVPPIARLVLGSRALSSSVDIEAPTPGGGLVADAWFYVYARDSSGVLALESSADPPDSALVFKDGDTTRRYLGCFRCNSGGTGALAFRKCGRRYLYRGSADSGGGELRVKFGTGAVGSYTDLLIARDDTAGDELIPPHARLAILQSQLSPNTGIASLVFRTNGDTGVAFRHEEADGLSSAYRQWEVETDAMRKLEYTFTTPGGTTSYLIRCAGFEE